MGAPDIKVPSLPAPPPDYADQAIREAALAQRQRSLTGASRRKSFLGGTAAASTPATTSPAAKTFLGT